MGLLAFDYAWNTKMSNVIPLFDHKLQRDAARAQHPSNPEFTGVLNRHQFAETGLERPESDENAGSGPHSPTT